MTTDNKVTKSPRADCAICHGTGKAETWTCTGCHYHPGNGGEHYRLCYCEPVKADK